MLLLAALLWAFILGWLQHGVAAQLSTTLSQQLGVQVSVASVEIDLLQQKLAVYGLRIPQPAGFGDGDVLYIPEFEAMLRLWDLMPHSLQIQNV